MMNFAVSFAMFRMQLDGGWTRSSGTVSDRCRWWEDVFVVVRRIADTDLRGPEVFIVMVTVRPS